MRRKELVQIETASETRDLTPEELRDAIEASLRDFQEGDILEGTVVKIDRDEVLLDIGYKSEGVIPTKELSIRHDVEPSQVVGVGDKVEALVLQKEDKEGRLILSKKRAQYERAWGKIEEVMQSGGTIKGPVIEVVKGGLILDIGLRGFLPASLVDLRRVRDLHPFVGTELEAKIIELDRNRNNVVLSRRAFLEESQSEGRKKFLESLQKGERRKGTVSSIVNFGAFVDLGGVDGLVHVSELSWKHVDHPSEIVQVGQEVEVEVLDVDLERERVSLSLKATQEDPWKEFERKYSAGEIMDGQVTKLVPFGAFVRVAAGDRGPGPHLRDRGPAHRLPRVRPVRRRPGPSEGHRGRRAAPQDQPVDASGRRRHAHPGPRSRKKRRPRLDTRRRGGAGRGLGLAGAAAANRTSSIGSAEVAPTGRRVGRCCVRPPPRWGRGGGPAGDRRRRGAPSRTMPPRRAGGDCRRGAPGRGGPAAEEDISLEAILEDLKRREGRSE